MILGLLLFAVFRDSSRKVGCGPPYNMPSGMRMSLWPRFSNDTRMFRLVGFSPKDIEIIRPLLAGPHSTGAATAGSTDMSTVDASSQKRPIPGLDTISIQVVPTASSCHSGHRLPGSTLNVKSADLKFAPFHFSV